MLLDGQEQEVYKRGKPRERFNIYGDLNNNLCCILTLSHHLITGERKVSVAMAFSYIAVVVEHDFTTHLKSLYGEKGLTLQ